MDSRNDKYWLLAALVFGVFVLPWIVYQTGVHVFGTYARGGATAFVGDFFRGLVAVRWFSWTLALGPFLLVGLWRGFARMLMSNARAARGDRA
jgi:hypothetical protein